MKTNPTSLRELQRDIRELESRKTELESEFRASVRAFSESLRPENILLFIAGKLVGRWADKQHEKAEKETKDSTVKDALLGFARNFASGAFEKVVDAFGKKKAS